MSARRIARELAVILMPQLPKERHKLSRTDYDTLIAKSVRMLVDYAKQCLSDANALILRSNEKLNEIEIEHPKQTAKADEELNSVPIQTGDLKEQLANIELAIEFVSEALDIPEMALYNGRDEVEVQCRNCDHLSKAYIDRAKKSDVHEFIVELISTYLEHRREIDEFIRGAKAKWQVERMVSIDRDIIRLACTEAFYMPDVPINVCISEAVELGHRFADKKAAKFINGVLADLSEESRYFRLNGEFRQSVESSPTGSAS